MRLWNIILQFTLKFFFLGVGFYSAGPELTLCLAQVGFELMLSSCLSFPRAEIIGMSYCLWLRISKLI